jgi:hypothetical protein
MRLVRTHGWPYPFTDRSWEDIASFLDGMAAQAARYAAAKRLAASQMTVTGDANGALGLGMRYNRSKNPSCTRSMNACSEPQASLPEEADATRCTHCLSHRAWSTQTCRRWRGRAGDQPASAHQREAFCVNWWVGVAGLSSVPA